MRNDNGTISGRGGGLPVYPSDPFIVVTTSDAA